MAKDNPPGWVDPKKLATEPHVQDHWLGDAERKKCQWRDGEVPAGHHMSFKRAIKIVGTWILLRVPCPRWIFECGPAEQIREARDGFVEFRVCSKYWGPSLRNNPARTVIICWSQSASGSSLMRRMRKEADRNPLV